MFIKFVTILLGLGLLASVSHAIPGEHCLTYPGGSTTSPRVQASSAARLTITRTGGAGAIGSYKVQEAAGALFPSLPSGAWVDLLTYNTAGTHEVTPTELNLRFVQLTPPDEGTTVQVCIIDTSATTTTTTVPTTTTTLVDTVWIPSAGCVNNLAASVWDQPTSNMPTVECVTGSNTQKGVLSFDADTDQSSQIAFTLSPVWISPLDLEITWYAAATAGSAGWCAQLVCVSDGDTDDPAFPIASTANCVSDPAKTSTLQLNKATIADLAATGCSGGDLVHIKLSRDADGGVVTDSMTGSAKVIGIQLKLKNSGW